MAVVTNIDREHLDTYSDLEDIKDDLRRIRQQGSLLRRRGVCLDDGPVQDILPRIERRVVTYGISPQAHVSARDLVVGRLGSSYTATRGGEVLGTIEIRVPGHHNVLNSLAAVAVGLDLGIPFAAVAEGLAGFTGVDRRFQVRGDANGVTVIDDYGHHPTEIRATLEALRIRAGSRRTVVLFQPHRHTRTRALWDEFCRSFHQADVLLVTDIYAAGEEAIEGISAEALVADIQARGHRNARFVGDLGGARDAVREAVTEGDVLLTLGAGSVWTVGDSWLKGAEA